MHSRHDSAGERVGAGAVADDALPDGDCELSAVVRSGRRSSTTGPRLDCEVEGGIEWQPAPALAAARSSAKVRRKE